MGIVQGQAPGWQGTFVLLPAPQGPMLLPRGFPGGPFFPESSAAHRHLALLRDASQRPSAGLACVGLRVRASFSQGCTRGKAQAARKGRARHGTARPPGRPDDTRTGQGQRNWVTCPQALWVSSIKVALRPPQRSSRRIQPIKAPGHRVGGHLKRGDWETRLGAAVMAGWPGWRPEWRWAGRGSARLPDARSLARFPLPAA